MFKNSYLSKKMAYLFYNNNNNNVYLLYINSIKSDNKTFF